MLENLVRVGPPLPSTQAAQSSRDPKMKDPKNDKFVSALKDANSKKDAAEVKADRSGPSKDGELRESTETKVTGIKQTKAKLAKKGGKEEAEEEISKFMDSLQSEIGISPARLAEALQKNEFPPQVANNEDAMEKLSESLDLDGDSSSKLHKLLLGLEQRLKDLNPIHVKGLLKMDAQTLVKDSQTLPVMKLIEGQALSRAQKNESEDTVSFLDSTSLNNQLGMIQPTERGLDPKLLKLQAETLGASQNLAMAGATTASVLAAEKVDMRQKISDLNERFWMKNPAGEISQPQSSSSLLPQGFEDRVRAMMSDNADLAASSLQQDAPGTPWMGSQKTMENLNMGEPSMGSDSFTGDGRNSFGEKSAKDSGDSLSEINGLNAQALSLSSMTPTHAVAGGLGAGGLTMISMQDRQENIQNILNGAQILVKDGGGEMKVQMSPEGMGPVELKVSMQDGRLNVEMLTESQEAKKLIESQLTDLKMGLAGHKLAVDSLKVDVVQRLNTDSNTQNFTNLNQQQNQQQSHEQMRQLWNQFSDQFGSQRKNSYFDVRAPKENVAQKDALNPISTNSQAVKPRRVVGKGEGLNLVA